MDLDFTGPLPSPKPHPFSLSECSPEALAVAEYIARHCQGPDRAQTAAQIGAALNLDVADQGRKVRRLLSAYRDLLPALILGDPGLGFYVPSSTDQVGEYDRMLWSQLRSIAITLSAHRRLAAAHGYSRSGSGPRVTYAVAQNPRCPPALR